MQWSQLLSSMDEETFKNLEISVSQESNKRLREKVLGLPELNAFEKECELNGDRTEAVKRYRDRTNSGLREACEKVNQFSKQVAVLDRASMNKGSWNEGD